MGHIFSICFCRSHFLARCHILSGHKESASLFEAAGGVGQERWRPKRWQKRWLQEGETEKVAAVEIIEKANPRYRGGKRTTLREEMRRYWEAVERVRGFFHDPLRMIFWAEHPRNMKQWVGSLKYSAEKGISRYVYQSSISFIDICMLSDLFEVDVKGHLFVCWDITMCLCLLLRI